MSICWCETRPPAVLQPRTPRFYPSHFRFLPMPLFWKPSMIPHREENFYNSLKKQVRRISQRTFAGCPGRGRHGYGRRRAEYKKLAKVERASLLTWRYVRHKLFLKLSNGNVGIAVSIDMKCANCSCKISRAKPRRWGMLQTIVMC